MINFTRRLKWNFFFKNILIATHLVFYGCNNTPADVSELPNDTIGFDNKNKPIINLIKNGNFEYWDKRTPLGWDIAKNRFFFKRKIINDSNSGLLISGNKSGQLTARQEIKVSNNTFYLAEVEVSYNNYNWDYGGLSITGGESDKILGFHHYTFSDGDSIIGKKLSVKFNSGNNSTIYFDVGYPDGINTSAFYDGAVLIETREVPIEFRYELANILSDTLELQPFDSTHYHDNVKRFCIFITNFYGSTPKKLDRYKNSPEFETTNRIKKQNRANLISIFDKYIPNSNVSIFLKGPVSNDVYPQMSTLSITDLLNVFNIPTRQVHMRNDEAGFHQFFEYWHPYYEKWVIIDTFYGFTYVDKKGNFISSDNLKTLNPEEIETNHLKRYPEIANYKVDSLLRAGWRSNIEIQYQGDKRLTYTH